MRIEREVLPFTFPNFLTFRDAVYTRTEGPAEKDKVHVGKLTDDQASDYWDEIKPLWLEHVKKARQRQNT